MEITVETLPSTKVYQDSKLRHQLASLTLRGSSGMRDALYDKKSGRVILAKTPEGRVVGWGWVFDWGEVHVYVNRRFRKKGVGTQIAKRARDLVRRRRRPRDVVSYPWDEAGRKLFAKAGIRNGNYT